MLDQLVIVLIAAVVAVPLLQRLGFGSVLGYLAAGLVVGPFGLAVTDDVEAVLHFSDLGVILLLFVIGLELQPSRLRVLRRPIFGLGGAQVLATTAVIGAIAYWLSVPAWGAFTIGIAAALSSTAFILQTLAERKELATRAGRDAFAILLFQDLAVIPVMVLLPIVAPHSNGAEDPLRVAAQAVGAVALVVIAGRPLLQRMFRLVARYGGREIFTAAALLTVIGTAWLLSWAGLSASLGAFIAGVLLADSEFRHEIEAVLDPFKGMLLGLFFVAVGMTVNLGLVWSEPAVILGLAFAGIAIKSAIVFGIASLGGTPARAAAKLAVVLAAGGEFAFVILALGGRLTLLDAALSERLIAAITLSMMLAPLLILAFDRYERYADARAATPDFDPIDEPPRKVILIGFGRFGQVIARILRMRGIPFTALEASVDQVDLVRRFGTKVYYGDASHLELLHAAHVGDAHAVVLAIGNVEASVRIARVIRTAFPHVRVYARARNRRHCYALFDLGIEDFIRDTFLSAVEMGTAVLRGIGDTPEQATRAAATFRSHDEALLLKQYALKGDEVALTQSAREAAEELKRLYEDDTEGMRVAPDPLPQP